MDKGSRMAHVGKTLEWWAEPIAEKDIEAFRRATFTEYSSGMPPTFPTIYREAEFKWLDVMQVDLKDLLHTDQEYEVYHELRSGDRAKVLTKLKELKERLSRRERLMFFILENEVIVEDRVVVLGRTTFVVREKLEAA